MIPSSPRVRAVVLAVIAGSLVLLFGSAVPTVRAGTVSSLGPAFGGLRGGGPGLTMLTASGAPGTSLGGRVPQAVTATDLAPSSAMTVSGRGAAAGLKVTVSQTTNLVNQTIDVSWTGATPTVGTPNFATNYLQIMQCWGNTSPDRSQCQFGAKAAFDTRGGENAASRKLNQPGYKDPIEPLTKDLPAQADAYVPFESVSCDGIKDPVKDCKKGLIQGPATLKNPFFDQSTTNEIPFAASRGNGTGFETFEAQTFREAPGLGCGDIAAAGTLKGQVRKCWLVVVPRGDTEVDGAASAAVLANGSHRLDTSPLSTTNWAKRIVVPLKFASVGQLCPISAKQRPLGGAEPAAEAVLRWQPALCRNNGPVFSYTQISDPVVARKLVGPTPGVAFLTAPVPAAQVPSDRILVYAPIAVSGISFAVMMERQTAADAPPADKSLDGQRITDLNLTPRLVAKLLTQSYLLDVGPNARYLKANPGNISKDPDFLAINPQFKKLDFRDSIETLVPIGLSDSYSTLWRWIASDQDARDFIAGLPDKWGMRVNPFYQGLDIPRDSFAKVDPFCDGKTVPGAPPLCTLDRHPYAQDFHDADRSAARGDQLSRTNWDVNGTPPAWKKNAPQLNGQRHILATGDTATAARFGLVTAKLRNAAGRFVAPTQKSLAAGVSVMRKDGAGALLASDPESSSKSAYPLTVVTYAATAPNILTQAEANDYALFIRYAAGTGQKLGDGLGNLPDGYLPLTPALRKQALIVAQQVQSRIGPPAVKSPGSSGGSGGGSGSGNGGSAGGTSGPAAAATPSASTSAPAAALPTSAIKKVTLKTPGVPAVVARYVLLIALTLGICALVFGLMLPRLMRRLGK